LQTQMMEREEEDWDNQEERIKRYLKREGQERDIYRERDREREREKRKGERGGLSESLGVSLFAVLCP